MFEPTLGHDIFLYRSCVNSTHVSMGNGARRAQLESELTLSILYLNFPYKFSWCENMHNVHTNTHTNTTDTLICIGN
jgi:hypothetical protein